MKPTIKMIEDLSLNAWPSHQIQLYDGWLLRFSYFYTHRTTVWNRLDHPRSLSKKKLISAKTLTIAGERLPSSRSRLFFRMILKSG